MINKNEPDIELDEVVEILGISVDEAYSLPIRCWQEPDGYIWYRRRDVERLRKKGWKPQSEEDGADPRDEDDWDGPPR
jgi:hypothetical protein